MRALAAFALVVLLRPWESGAAERNFTLSAENKRIEIGAGMTYAAWTYDGTIPGPLLRVRQGDQVKIRLINRTTSAHGIDIAAARIVPGLFNGSPGARELSYTFTATAPGVYAYHCSAIPVLAHVAGGMYGMIVVEPRGGWPNGNAQEVTLVQGEFYGTPDARGFIAGSSRKMLESTPDFVVFNGKINRYDVDHPLSLKAGKLTRIFFVNAGPNLISTFHVAGVIFSTVYRSGNPANAMQDVASFEVGPGAGAVFEFRADAPGDYPFADQTMAHPYKGAMGIFRVTR